MVIVFNTKLFCAEVKFSLVELGPSRQFPNEVLDLHVKRFHEKALDSCDLIDKEVLVDILPASMVDEYRFFLENLPFPFLD